MTSAKRVIAALEILEKERQLLHAEVSINKHHLLVAWQNNRWLSVVALCSAFLIGWKRPRLMRGAKGIKTIWSLLPLFAI